MSEIIDAYRLHTVKLEAPGVPRASIISISAPDSAREGEQFDASMTVENVGDGDGYIFGRLIDADTGEEIGSITSTLLAVGETAKFTWTLTMPGRDLTIRFEAGHIEPEFQPL